jgi:hypothetical protein
MTRSTADAVLKEYYLPRVRQVLNNEVFLLSQVEANSEDIEGRRAVLAINTGRNSGIGARAEMGILPAAGQQGYSEERVVLKYNYGRIMVSGPVMKSTRSDAGSFVRAVGSETEGVTRDLKNDVNRQLYGDGTGAIATVTAVAAAAAVPLTTPTPTQLRQLQIGMVVDIGTVANPQASVAGAVIASINTTTGTVTFTAPVTTTAGHFIFRSGSGGTGATQKEMTGLAVQISDTGILWNIDPLVVGQAWQSFVKPVNGAASEDMYIEAEHEVGLRSGSRINLWVTTAEVHRATAKLLTSLKRFPGTTVLNGGYSALDMSSQGQGNQGPNTVAMYFDKDCQTGVAYGLNTQRLQFYRMSDWEFMEEDGAVLARLPGAQGQDAYEATLFLYAELATDARNNHAKLTGIT